MGLTNWTDRMDRLTYDRAQVEALLEYEIAGARHMELVKDPSMPQGSSDPSRQSDLIVSLADLQLAMRRVDPIAGLFLRMHYGQGYLITEIAEQVKYTPAEVEAVIELAIHCLLNEMNN